MSVTFTPGPWTATGRIIESASGNAEAIVNVAAPEAVAHANARLIAAAPDLYEAVRLFLLEYQHITPKDERDPVWIGRTAIAKASP